MAELVNSICRLTDPFGGRPVLTKGNRDPQTTSGLQFRPEPQGAHNLAE